MTGVGGRDNRRQAYREVSTVSCQASYRVLLRRYLALVPMLCVGAVCDAPASRDAGAFEYEFPRKAWELLFSQFINPLLTEH